MNRRQAVDESVHSGEMEGSYVSEQFDKDAEQYVKGDISIEELMRRTKRRWQQTDEKGKAHA